MEVVTLAVSGYWVVCRDDDDCNEEFGPGQFDEAQKYLRWLRMERPWFNIELIATIAL